MLSHDQPSGAGGLGRERLPEGGPLESPLDLLPQLRRMVTRRYQIPAQDCEDVVQDAIVDFLLQRKKYATLEPGLLVVIARRRCADYWRSKGTFSGQTDSLELIRENDPRLPTGQGDKYVDGLLDGIALAVAWPKITERCKDFLTRRFFGDEAVREIAKSVGDAPGTVKRYMSRCLAKLRAAMAVCA